MPYSARISKNKLQSTALTLVIFLTAMSISNNAAIPLLGLPGKYSLASSELERNILAYIIAGV